jgi:hypothetical protein
MGIKVARGTLVVFTNPVTKEREAEFNDWYNNIHALEVTSLQGFSAIRRLRVGPDVRGVLRHRYLAIYECSDVDQARASLDAHTAAMNISDALGEDAIAVFFEDIFSLRASDAIPGGS